MIPIRLKLMLEMLLAFSFGSVAIAATAASGQNLAQRAQPLNVVSALIWEGPIPVCWDTAGYSTEKAIVQLAVRNAWARHTSAKFIGWRDCEPTASGIRILVEDSGPRVKKLGKSLDGMRSGMILNFTFKNWNSGCTSSEADRYACIQKIAVHEFGHALGFAHEQNRGDAKCGAENRQGQDGDTVTGLWDLQSVMNYCNPNWNNNGDLSAPDIEGARVFYGVPQSARKTAPPGSYTQTCHNIMADEKRLYAICSSKKGGGHTLHTSLSAYTTCKGDIANLDGSLGCTTLPLPAGTYQSSCRDIAMDVDTLRASCRKRDGKWAFATLINYPKCTSDISNNDGALKCQKGFPPNGSYKQSCTDIEMDVNMLHASCRTRSGESARTNLARVELCVGDISNDDGMLRCNNGLVLPAGSYQQSCRSLFMNGATRISARCRNRGGSWLFTVLDDPQNCIGDIGNNDGTLSCRR